MVRLKISLFLLLLLGVFVSCKNKVEIKEYKMNSKQEATLNEFASSYEKFIKSGKAGNLFSFFDKKTFVGGNGESFKKFKKYFKKQAPDKNNGWKVKVGFRSISAKYISMVLNVTDGNQSLEQKTMWSYGIGGMKLIRWSFY